MADLRGKRVVLFLEPQKLGFQITYTLLETAHLGDHAGIGAADVTEQSLRHCKGSSTLSDQSGHTR